MTEQTKHPVSLGPGSYHNKSRAGAPPVAILNEESSTKDRLIYCEGIVANLEFLVELGADHESHAAQALACLVSNQLEPLHRLLQSLVSECEKAGGLEP